MALYTYEGMTRNGKRVNKTIDAPTADAVRQQLQQAGIYPISIAIATEKTADATLFVRMSKYFQAKVTPKDKILFTKQLSVLLSSGIPLLQALELLIDQFHGQLRYILIEIKDGMREGSSFNEQLAVYPRVFDTTYVQLIRAGEASGKLETILDRLVGYMEQQQTLAKKVTGALRYPIMQISIVVLVVIGLLTFVIPQFAETFVQMGRELPWTTQFLVNVSDFVIGYYLYMILFGIVLLAGYLYWKSTPDGMQRIDKFKLQVPVIGYFTQMGAVVQFCRTLGMLMQAGVNLSDALDIVVKIIDNRILLNVLMLARDNIIKQGKIAEFLEQTGMFPPIAIYLIKTGEQSGNLPEMLLTVAQNYEADLGEYADGLTGLIEPVMQIVMAVIVGFVIFAIMGAVQPDAAMFET